MTDIAKNPKGVGYYPPEYEPKIHGPYYPWRYYGKPDIKFGDLKLKEIWSWLGRRSFSPSAIYNCGSRNFHYYHYKWIDTKVGIAAPAYHFAVSAMLLSYVLFFSRYYYERKRKHH
ncbi:unnamed protein product [Gordionus sp. m RMFG-2023]|uniref:putative ATP synthase subunit f, mitochondrial n=1 Tax=Gordionus sp. m RMFG-2023 TaxID=3053472 RepID=UPI0030E54328